MHNHGNLVVQLQYTTGADSSRLRCKIDAVGASSSAYTTSSKRRCYCIIPTYQWERSDDGGANYSPIGGATSATYTTPTLVFANDNLDRYRAVVSLVGSQHLLHHTIEN